jgi:NAD(P)-dependent dehydrogenase (short-subunit alcohol dehydrogenase family)
LVLDSTLTAPLLKYLLAWTKGKLAIVTGSYSGLGLETTRALTNAGTTVVVPARRPEYARRAIATFKDVEVAELDLSDLASVHKFAERFMRSGRQVDIIINNTAIMACPEARVGNGW